MALFRVANYLHPSSRSNSSEPFPLFSEGAFFYPTQIIYWQSLCKANYLFLCVFLSSSSLNIFGFKSSSCIMVINNWLGEGRPTTLQASTPPCTTSITWWGRRKSHIIILTVGTYYTPPTTILRLASEARLLLASTEWNFNKSCYYFLVAGPLPWSYLALGCSTTVERILSVLFVLFQVE